VQVLVNYGPVRHQKARQRLPDRGEQGGQGTELLSERRAVEQSACWLPPQLELRQVACAYNVWGKEVQICRKSLEGDDCFEGSCSIGRDHGLAGLVRNV